MASASVLDSNTAEHRPSRNVSSLPAKEARVLLDFDNHDRLFAFPASVTEDGKLVATILEPYDYDYEEYVEQRLVVSRVDDDKTIIDLKLSSLYDEDSVEAMKKNDPRVRREYVGRQERANAVLARHRWRPLVEGCGISATLQDWKLSIVPANEKLPCFEERVDRWAPPSITPHCRPVNDVLIGNTACDPTSGLLFVEVGMNGGHVGCLPPPTEAHFIHVKPSCLAPGMPSMSRP